MLFLVVLFTTLTAITIATPLPFANSWSLVPFTRDRMLSEEIHLVPESSETRRASAFNYLPLQVDVSFAHLRGLDIYSVTKRRSRLDFCLCRIFLRILL